MYVFFLSEDVTLPDMLPRRKGHSHTMTIRVHCKYPVERIRTMYVCRYSTAFCTMYVTLLKISIYYYNTFYP